MNLSRALLLVCMWFFSSCAARTPQLVIDPGSPPSYFELVKSAAAEFENANFHAAAQLFERAAEAAGRDHIGHIRALKDAAWSHLLADDRGRFVETLNRLCRARFGAPGRPRAIGENGNELNELFSIPVAGRWRVQPQCPRAWSRR